MSRSQTCSAAMFVSLVLALATRLSARPVALPVAAGAARMAVGVNDREPAKWSGEIAVDRGEILSLTTRQKEDGGARSLSWKAASTRQARKRKRSKASGPVRPGQLSLVVSDGSARVTVTTQQGAFTFVPADLPWQPQTYLNGAVRVERQLPGISLGHTPEHEMFPAAAAGPEGTVWAVYASYTESPPIDRARTEAGEFDSVVMRNNGDQLWLRSYRDGEWGSPIALTQPRLDIWRPAVTVARDGTVWAAWAQNVAGNWELFARSYVPASGRPGQTLHLTRRPSSGIEVVLAAAPNDDTVWLAWQGWNAGAFDIYLARLTPDGLRDETRVSTSDANDWHPALAVTSDGSPWVAWDTYDKGDYDVYARQRRGGKLLAPVAIAASPRFEARPSIAVDSRDRLWVAFEDGRPQWGKDYGDRWTGKMGEPLYHERNILVRVIDGGSVRQTTAELQSLKIQTHFDDRRKQTRLDQRISFPRLLIDRDDRPLVLYRRHPVQSAGGEKWITLARSYAGERWTEERVLPNSTHLLDVRPAAVVLSSGLVLVVHTSDGRTAGSASSQNAELYATLLPGAPASQAPVTRPIDPAEPRAAVPAVHPTEGDDIAALHGHDVVDATGKTLHLLRGEFHRHTEFSAHRDWDGSMDDMWRYALDAARMDWLGPGDHDYATGKEFLWWLTQKRTTLYHHPPTFTAAYTYERSMGYPSGHRNVMFPRRGIRPLPHMQGRDKLFGTPEKGAPDIHNLYAYLKRFGAICSSHTSATNMGTDWRNSDPAVEPVVEIYQGHRLSYEEPNAPHAASRPEDSIQGWKPDGFVWQALKKGIRLGFQSSSDHVSTHISYAIVMAADNSRQAIIDALKQRHSYAAHDNILLDVRCGRQIMGDEFTSTQRPRLAIYARAPLPIVRVDIVRQAGRQLPQYVHALQPNRKEIRFDWTDEAAVAGAVNMYYVRVMQANQGLAWGSPMWIHYQP